MSVSCKYTFSWCTGLSSLSPCEQLTRQHPTQQRVSPSRSCEATAEAVLFSSMTQKQFITNNTFKCRHLRGLSVPSSVSPTTTEWHLHPFYRVPSRADVKRSNFSSTIFTGNFSILYHYFFPQLYVGMTSEKCCLKLAYTMSVRSPIL